jgi:hypothetical protein
MGISDEDRELIGFLISHHLFMVETALRITFMMNRPSFVSRTG